MSVCRCTSKRFSGLPQPDSFVPRKPLVIKDCVIKIVVSIRKGASDPKEFENGNNKILFPLKIILL